MKLLFFKSKVIISLFETVRLSVSISLRNLYNSLNSIKEIAPRSVFLQLSWDGRVGRWYWVLSVLGRQTISDNSIMHAVGVGYLFGYFFSRQL